MLHRDFPGSPVVKNLPCNAGDIGSIPGQGAKILHATEQLSLHAATTKPEPHTRESVRRKGRPRMTQPNPVCRNYDQKQPNAYINILKIKNAA